MAGTTPPNERTCQICKLRHNAHTGNKCRSCDAPIEHHTPEQQDECWEGRARMAWAKRQSGLRLNDVEHESLRRCPNPEILSLFGYRQVT